MIKQIVRDIFFLGQPSEPATQADLSVGRDLLDTLQANRQNSMTVRKKELDLEFFVPFLS